MSYERDEEETEDEYFQEMETLENGFGDLDWDKPLLLHHDEEVTDVEEEETEPELPIRTRRRRRLSSR